MPVPAIDPASPFVSFERVTRNYGTFRIALTEVSFAVGRSEFLWVTGPSGAGKSTILRLIAGLDRASSGRVRVAGEDVATLTRRKLAFLRRSIGIVLQELVLLDDRSVLDNVMLPALASQFDPPEASRRAGAALERVGLDPKVVGALAPRELSGGAQQRVALARAVVNRPALVLADEPTSQLDADSAAGILHLLEQFAIAGVTVIFASHQDVTGVPARARRLVLSHGRVAETTP
jgi:cell division transport system ATP-binding protein